MTTLESDFVTQKETRNNNVMINASKMAKPFCKWVTNWKNTKQTQALIKQAIEITNIPYNELIVIDNGTWIHEILLPNFKNWLGAKKNFDIPDSYDNKIEVIASLNGYKVTDNGIFLNPKGKTIKTLTGKYINMNLKANGKMYKLYAHRLQAYQKYGTELFKSGIVTRHLNNDQGDNSIDNIAIGTHSQNAYDMPRDFRLKRALIATSYIRKYNRQVIKTFYDVSKSKIETMKMFNIPRIALNHLLRQFR